MTWKLLTPEMAEKLKLVDTEKYWVSYWQSANGTLYKKTKRKPNSAPPPDRIDMTLPPIEVHPLLGSNGTPEVE